MSISPVKLTFKNGTTLFRQDESIQKVYLIDSGQVVLKVKAGGQDVSLVSVGKGDLLGEHVMFGERQYKMTAIADSEVSAYVMSTEDLVELFKQIPRPLQVMLGSSIKKAANLLEDHKQRLQNTSHLKTFSNYGQLMSFYLLVLQDFNYGGIIRLDDVKTSILSLFNLPSSLTEKVINILHEQHIVEVIESTQDTATNIQVGDLTPVVHFIDYFRKFYLQGDKSHYFEINEHLLNVMTEIIKEGADLIKRNGFVELNYSKLVANIRNDHGFTINEFHFNYLNRLGVFVEKKNSGLENNYLLVVSLEDLVRLKEFWSLLSALQQPHL